VQDLQAAEPTALQRGLANAGPDGLYLNDTGALDLGVIQAEMRNATLICATDADIKKEIAILLRPTSSSSSGKLPIWVIGAIIAGAGPMCCL
jgi:hypothetical protein